MININKLIYCIYTIVKCGIWQPVKFHLVSRVYTESKMKWIFFLSYLWINVTNINSMIKYKSFHFWASSRTSLQAARCHILWLC